VRKTNTYHTPTTSRSPCYYPSLTVQRRMRRFNNQDIRRVVGQLTYGMVHTLYHVCPQLTVALWEQPGGRHILFLRHLFRNVKYSKEDTLMLKSHTGPLDIETMTPLMQLYFQCDADLGGNRDNDHSQTFYLGYLAGNLICCCSTDQGSISTSTAESEIKAVNHTLKAEVIAHRGILNMIGSKETTRPPFTTPRRLT
jgi:hypothetical protein